MASRANVQDREWNNNSAKKLSKLLNLQDHIHLQNQYSDLSFVLKYCSHQNICKILLGKDKANYNVTTNVLPSMQCISYSSFTASIVDTLYESMSDDILGQYTIRIRILSFGFIDKREIENCIHLPKIYHIYK